MRLYSLTVLFKKADGKVLSLKAASDLTSFGYFQRGSVQEFMTFSSQILVERTQPGQRSSVKEQEYVCHVYVRSDSLAAVLISDHEYPRRVSFTLLNKVVDQFAMEVPQHQWAQGGDITFTALEGFLSKYQDPKQADAMCRLQQDLDETKIILHDTIDAVLARGEQLDDLVAKSEGLSLQSKTFYKTARKQNSCCAIM